MPAAKLCLEAVYPIIGMFSQTGNISERPCCLQIEALEGGHSLLSGHLLAGKTDTVK